MNWLPLNLSLGLPLEYQLIYYCSSLIVALIGWNRVLGFWGFLFFSIIFSPVFGLFIALIASPRKSRKMNHN